MGVPSIEPFWGGGGASQGALSTPPPSIVSPVAPAFMEHRPPIHPVMDLLVHAFVTPAPYCPVHALVLAPPTLTATRRRG